MDIFWTFYLNHLSPLWGYFFKISISSCTHCTCFNAKVYGLWVMGGLSPVGISIFNSGVFPKSAESLEKISWNSEHRFSNASLCWGATSASFNLIGSLGSMSAEEVMKPFLSPFRISSSLSCGTQGSSTLIQKMSSWVIRTSSGGACSYCPKTVPCCTLISC